MLRDQMPRTTCACEHCQVGCRTMPGMCSCGDISRIAVHVLPDATGDEREQFIADHFVASEGAKVAKIERCGGTVTFNIPTISPAQKPNGECVFYEQGRCTIHAVSPAGCALVDSHMSRDEGNVIVGALLAEIHADRRADGPYSRLWQHLNGQGKTARPRIERRTAFEAAFAKCGPCQQRKPPQPLDA